MNRPRAITDALAQEAPLDSGLRENARADEKLTAFFGIGSGDSLRLDAVGGFVRGRAESGLELGT